MSTRVNQASMNHHTACDLKELSAVRRIGNNPHSPPKSANTAMARTLPLWVKPTFQGTAADVRCNLPIQTVLGELCGSLKRVDQYHWQEPRHHPWLQREIALTADNRARFFIWFPPVHLSCRVGMGRKLAAVKRHQTESRFEDGKKSPVMVEIRLTPCPNI